MTDAYRGLYIMIGPPGTGKTRTLSKIVAKIMKGKEDRLSRDHSPVLICSLTRTAAAEIAGRVDLPPAAVATIHAHAFRSAPMPPLVSTDLIESGWNKEHPGMALSPGIFSRRPDEDRSRFAQAPGDEIFEEVDLLRNRLVPPDRWAQYQRYFHDGWSSWKEAHGVIDFSDMLDRAGDEPPMGAYYLFVDEAQDTSRLAFRVIQRWMFHCSATFVVGDPWQCLYEWAGGDPSILFDDTIPADHRAVLSQSYRVPEAVHDHATAFVRQLSDWRPVEYLPRREDPADKESAFVPGCVDYSPATWEQPGPAVDDALDWVEAGKSCMFAVASNNMAARLVWHLRERGILFSNPWRLSNGAWNPLGRRDGTTSTMDRICALLTPLSEGWTTGHPSWTYGQLWAILDALKDVTRRGAKKDLAFWAKEKSTAGSPCPPDRLVEWMDPAVLEDLLSTADPQRWLAWWEHHLQPSRAKAAVYPLKIVRDLVSGPFWSVDEVSALESRLYVGTIHSFKGAEADCVYLFPDLPQAAMNAYLDGDRDPVIRMFYVGMTRAKERLVLCRAAGRNSIVL